MTAFAIIVLAAAIRDAGIRLSNAIAGATEKTPQLTQPPGK